MRLQKHRNRKIGNKEYSKWEVIIPPSTVEKLGWTDGQELMGEIQGKKLKLVPKGKKNS